MEVKGVKQSQIVPQPHLKWKVHQEARRALALAVTCLLLLEGWAEARELPPKQGRVAVFLHVLAVEAAALVLVGLQHAAVTVDQSQMPAPICMATRVVVVAQVLVAPGEIPHLFMLLPAEML